MAAASMTGPEARAIRERLGLRVEDVAANVGQTPHVVEAWEDGRIGVPRDAVSYLRWSEATTERARAMEASGLPECAWVATWFAKELAPGRRPSRAALSELEKHGESCAVCQAREAYAQTLPPLPERPFRGVFGRALAWVSTKPGWLHAPLLAAMGFAGVTAVRLAFALLGTIGQPAALPRLGLTALLALPASAATGFCIGAIWSAFAPMRARGGAIAIVAYVLAAAGMIGFVALVVSLADRYR